MSAPWTGVILGVALLSALLADGLFWASTRHLVLEASSICRKTRRLRGRQAAICRQEPEVVRAVVEGVSLARKECQWQFEKRRWNCTLSRRSLRKILQRDSRETGFVHATVAAAVTYEVTQACSQGALPNCTCVWGGSLPSNPSSSSSGRSPPPASVSAGVLSHWGGCSDNIDFGYSKSKEFMEERFRKRSDLKTMVLRHNYEAGRMAVRQHMTVKCKCHGMSGSCTLKSCWRKLPPFREVGTRLKDRFDGAVKVTAGNDGKGFIPEGGTTIKAPSPQDLVYSEESPDFCEADKSTGSLGTRGRPCNDTSMGVDGCDLLCCGRRHVTTRQVIQDNCRCRFKWCCEVQCDTCQRSVKVSRCL